MAAKIRIPETMLKPVAAFIKSESIPLEVIAEGECAVQISRPGERMKSDLFTIYSGGWIPCETARELAGKLEISLPSIGKLMNELDVKIKDCGLGCF
jgi:hypothetical protein